MMPTITLYFLVALAPCVSSMVFSGTNPSCDICGGTEMSVTKPLASIGEFNGLSFGNCITLSMAGERGFISPTQCIFLKTSNELQDVCGCMVSPAPTPVPKGKESDVVTVASPPTMQPGINPVCHVCGSESATVTKPNALIVVPKELNSPIPVVPCGTIADAGLSQLIPDYACKIAQETHEFGQVCGCIDPTEAADPTGPPTTKPEDDLAEDTFVTAAPISVLPTFSPSVRGSIEESWSESSALALVEQLIFAVSIGLLFN